MSERKQRLAVYAIGIASMEDLFNSLNFFIVEQQKIQDLFCKKSRLTACCLTILKLNIILNVLKVPQTHATPTFSDFKVDVYGVKGGRLWGKYVGLWVKGGRLWGKGKNAVRTP